MVPQERKRYPDVLWSEATRVVVCIAHLSCVLRARDVKLKGRDIQRGRRWSRVTMGRELR